jgi:hypothetical protein
MKRPFSPLSSAIRRSYASTSFRGTQPFYFLLVLCDALLEYRHLSPERGLPRSEEMPLPLQGFANLRVPGARQQVRGERDGARAVTLGGEPGFFRKRSIELATHDIVHGPGVCVLEPNQHVALVDVIPVPDEDLLHQPSLQMLNALSIGLDDDDTRRDGRAIEGRQSRPCTESAEGDEDGDESREDPRSRIRWRQGDALPSPARRRGSLPLHYADRLLSVMDTTVCEAAGSAGGNV